MDRFFRKLCFVLFVLIANSAIAQPIESFTLPPRGEKQISIPATTPLSVRAFGTLSPALAKEHCDKQEMGAKKVLVDMCIELEQTNPPAPKAGKGTVTKKISGGTIIGTTFKPNNGKIDVVVRSTASIAMPISITTVPK